MADDNSPKDAVTPATPVNPHAEWLRVAAARLISTEPYLSECTFPALKVSVEHLHQTMVSARDDRDLAFDVLLDHLAVDWPDKSEIELIYHLFSTTTGRYLSVITTVSRQNPVVPTLTDIWPVAELQEREVYDLFGILYDSHPDLRRLFLEDDWQGYPLRKDYKDDFMLELVK